jgi:hypothetical protein
MSAVGRRATDMMTAITRVTLLLFLLCTCRSLHAADVDAIDYDVTLRVSQADRRIEGTVIVQLAVEGGAHVVTLDAENLSITDVEEWEPARRSLRFDLSVNALRIELPEPVTPRIALRIRYTAMPTRGVRFTDGETVTYFHTPAWLPCIFDPEDRATMTMPLDVRESEETRCRTACARESRNCPMAGNAIPGGKSRAIPPTCLASRSGRSARHSAPLRRGRRSL